MYGEQHITLTPPPPASLFPTESGHNSDVSTFELDDSVESASCDIISNTSDRAFVSRAALPSCPSVTNPLPSPQPSQ
ncbi:hypothetical protein CERSUDRAFT_95769 [Gelatoporia subvermispora B]|uniref:Uncharacterized protein n=1 Tax=Ceriporiopsis subvermispora (strain B) TaxID=914234 RepID=M2QWG4_CERS8|nr:hypothetical protein CERSUDRAFT_95769 [Gelatoporia subvermispora B]